ncbi:TorF family putative porin [Rhodoferax sp.]|uniref:TorF family putative porin n=1 Tax=Rhodoferax sp. TaxID=50421 RepID=UPI0027210904|nr:TorF family putative porin [Rhodoferax sp.]MDO9196973.1 TorF family putative porin [Rhodoferax sp.]
MKLKATSALVLSTLLAGTAAMAQTTAPEPDYTLSYNVGVTSDYRFRGISQASFDPALQAGVDFAHKSGFYLGVWGSNVSWIKDYAGATDGSLEIDLYGGFKGAITKDLGFDVGVITYQYPKNTTADVAGLANANTTEIYGALSYAMFTAKYSRSVGNFIANANSSGSQYLEVAANFDLGSGFTLTPHVGRQTIPNIANDAGDYTDYSLTLTKDFGNGLSASIAAVGTDAKDAFYKVAPRDNLGKSTVVVGVKYSF